MAKLKAEDKIEEENKQKQTTESWKLQTSPKLGAVGWGAVLGVQPRCLCGTTAFGDTGEFSRGLDLG